MHEASWRDGIGVESAKNQRGRTNGVRREEEEQTKERRQRRGGGNGGKGRARVSRTLDLVMRESQSESDGLRCDNIM